MSQTKLGGVGVLLLVLGIGSLANGVWMLLDTVRWFGLIAVDTGDLNPHLVRDVGAAYVMVGVALTWAALRPGLRLPLTATATVFLTLHAVTHVYDLLVGALPASHWLEDAPGVFFPSIATLALCFLFAKQEPGAA